MRTEPSRSACERHRGEAGSALMLVPALVVVLVALGGIGVDLTLVHMAQRSAYRSLTAAVDDAAAMVDSRELQVSGEVRLDAAAAARVVRAHLGLLGTAGIGRTDSWAEPAFEVLDADVVADPDAGTVTATASVAVEHIFLAALPGLGDSTELDITSVARMLE